MNDVESEALSDSMLVFDVGGTSLRGALYDPEGGGLVGLGRAEAPSFRRYADAPIEALVELLAEALVGLGERVAGGRRVDGVGVGFPGPVTPEGRVVAAPTLWGERVERPLALLERLRSAWPGADVALTNDVTAAGYRYAESDGVTCVVNVGSGIGNKVFVDGEVVVGPSGLGGELGHWRVDDSPGAPLCECGGRGHLGALSSGRASDWQVDRLVGKMPEAFSSSPLAGCVREERNGVLVRAYADGDPFAVAVVEAMARPLGAGLAALQLGVGVEDFVVIGGFARALGAGYLDAVARGAADAGWTGLEDWRRFLRPGADDDDSGLVGLGILLERRMRSGT